MSDSWVLSKQNKKIIWVVLSEWMKELNSILVFLFCFFCLFAHDPRETWAVIFCQIIFFWNLFSVVNKNKNKIQADKKFSMKIPIFAFPIWIYATQIV